MNNNKPRILILSSADPTKGPGVLASDYYEAFKRQQYEVDVFTLNKCTTYPEFLYVRDTTRLVERIKNKIRIKYQKVFRWFHSKIHNCLKYPHAGYCFFYYKEENPPVRINEIISKIDKPYDIVYILFWQGMISFATIKALYEKLHCCIIFGGVDYSHMSGGCHFTGDCQRYKIGCGCCPAFDSNDPHDFTWHNVNYRRKVYSTVKPIVCGNSYMIDFYRQSVLLKDHIFLKTPVIIDTTLFKPLDKKPLYECYGITKNKTFKILFGCQSVTDERKGMNYLIDALNIFYDALTEEERSKILIMAIGKNFEKIKSQLHGFDTLDFGYVSKEELAKIYAFADVFLCPSVNDAGPMMVNQSLCCGTPVVGFEMGACIDAVKNQGTGYCAELRDYLGFAKGIEKIFRQTTYERSVMCHRCVEFARQTYSYEASVNRIVDSYHSYEHSSI